MSEEFEVSDDLLNRSKHFSKDNMMGVDGRGEAFVCWVAGSWMHGIHRLGSSCKTLRACLSEQSELPSRFMFGLIN